MAVKINKLFNSNWNNVDYGTERTKNSEIAVLPLVSELYEESTTSDMDKLICGKMLSNDLYDLFINSPWYEKYKDPDTKIDKRDISPIYFYFKDEINKRFTYTPVEVMCAICEFFTFNYSYVYNNVLSLQEKSAILKTLAEDHGLKTEFTSIKPLF